MFQQCRAALPNLLTSNCSWGPCRDLACLAFVGAALSRQPKCLPIVKYKITPTRTHTHIPHRCLQVGDNGKGIAGTALWADILPCKALDSTGGGTFSSVVRCIDVCRCVGRSLVDLVSKGFACLPLVPARLPAQQPSHWKQLAMCLLPTREQPVLPA